LLALLSGQSQPTAGTVEVAGLNPARDRAQLSELLGVLFAETASYERLTVRANLEFHCRVRGLPLIRAGEVLAQVGLSDHANTATGRLPHGLARRLAFGQAIVHHPQVMLLMEPFAGCESASRVLLARLTRRLANEGAVVLILTKEALGLVSLCDVVYSLENGRIAGSYSPFQDQQLELPFKIPARLEDQVALVNPADILYASIEEGQVLLHTPEGRVPTQFTLAELEQRLGQRGFFRAHRAYLVNLQRVKSIIPYTRDSFTLILDDPDHIEIPLSKASARELRELLGY
jgi:ABC-2 type transport system ATP-binding protein